MSAKRLEEFINLIETAEKISDVPPLQLSRKKSRSPPRQCQGTPKNNEFLNSSQSSVGSQPKVPHLNLPSSWSATPTPHRLVGPANSHCGLSVSDMSFNSPHSTRNANDAPNSTQQMSSRAADSHRSVADSTTTHRSTNGTDRSEVFQLPTTVRRGSSASQHSDIIVNLQKNSPFVRKISQEVHPASPDRSPMTQRKSSRNSSFSPEKKASEPQSKLPPRNPRSSLTGRIPSSGKQSSRHSSSSHDKTPIKSHKNQTPKSRQSSSSPEKTPIKSLKNQTPKSRQSSSSPEKTPNQSRDKQSPKSRTVSSSPSPVRSSAPKPTSPSLSRSYSSSFGSSSASSSPSKSPLKSNYSNRSNSIKTEGNESASSNGRSKSHDSEISLTTKRKSWVAASMTARSHNSRSFDKSNDSGEDIPDIMVKMSPKKEGKGKSNIPTRRPLKPNTGSFSKPTKAKVVIEENNAQNHKPGIKKRPQSAPNKKPIKAIRPEPAVELGEYSKSLKLLGIDVPSNRTEASKLSNQEVKVQTKEPTIRTRLLKRSGSYADLTRSIKKDMKKSEFEAVKSDLNNAIFEEWYFKKCEMEIKIKQKHKDDEEQKKKEEDEKKKEIEEQSKEEFDKWKKQKRKQAEKEKKKQEIIEKGKSPGKVVDTEEVDRKRTEWLSLKNKDIAKKKETEEKKRKEEEDKRIAEDTKRTEATKTFLAWKEKKTKELKERYLNEKKKQKDIEEAMIEKRKDADCAFIGWKNKKTENIKERKIRKEELKETNEPKVEKSEGTNKKLEEAKMAYEAWLDFIEAREEEKFMFEEERKRILMWKAPWYPGGKALF